MEKSEFAWHSADLVVRFKFRGEIARKIAFWAWLGVTKLEKIVPTFYFNL